MIWIEVAKTMRALILIALVLWVCWNGFSVRIEINGVKTVWQERLE